jgi:hypothetical protein
VDNLTLTGPNGTALNVGSWLRAADKPDYGAKGLVNAAYSETPYAEGGQLSYESVGVRHMSFPLILPSSGTFGGLTGLESYLRLLARPGATLDIQPDGETTAVRFDVLSGRWEQDYDTYENRVQRRKGILLLDTQPYGYLPTSIILASTASMALPGSIDLSGVSFIGDAPGLAELSVQATAATNYPPGTWLADTALWSLGGQPSMQAWWPGASMLKAGATLAGDFIANNMVPGGTAIRIFTNGLGASFTIGANVLIPTSLEPAYRGRFRVFLLAGNLASANSKFAFCVDSTSTYNAFAPLASAVPVATIYDASPAVGLIDCGELTLPQSGSGLVQSQHIRIWTAPVGVGAPATTADVIGGMYLHALDGANGFQPAGIAGQVVGPSGAPGLHPARFTAQAYERRIMSIAPITDLSSHAPFSDITGQHRGGFPLVAQASTSHLDLLIAARAVGTATPPIYSAPLPAAVSLTYRPRFSFLKGL